MGWIERSARCRRVLVVLAAGVVASMVTAGAWGQGSQLDSAEWRERCKQWIERKGYPVDYIELKTGKRQNGMAVSWKGNVKPEQVQMGDVVIRDTTTGKGRTIQVAGYVEAVEPGSAGSETFVTLSAMGQGGNRSVDAECYVTETFGQVSRMRVPLSAVARVWRPSLPLE